MKKIYLILTALCLCCSIQLLEAQTVIIPSTNPSGTFTSNSIWRKPLGTNRSYERTAIKYTHAEIATMGQITDIGFYADSINVPGYALTKIYMKEVTDSTFTASTVTAEETGATLVYDDSIPASAFVQGQWTMITLATPFLHVSTNNIEIIIETNSVIGTDINSLSKGFRYSAVTGAREQYWQSGSATSPTIPAGNGTLINGNRHNIQMIFAPAPTCVAPPTAGITLASNDSLCGSAVTALSLSGATTGSGLTYEWISSADSINWTSVSGANSSSYVTGVSGNTYFACVLTCSGQSDTSAPVLIVLNPFYNCYCTIGVGGNCATSAIDSVSINGTTLMNGPTGCSPTFYTQYPYSGNTTATLTQGQTYQLDTRYNGSTRTSIWIDYDHNGVFDTYEWTQVCLTSTNGVLVSSTFNVPLTAMTGTTGMRIRSRSSAGANDSTSACANFGTGEIEDYLVDITTAPPCSTPPSAGVTAASPDTLCAGTSTSLSISGYTSGTGTTFDWIASTDGGANWTSLGAASSPLLTISPAQTTWYACIVSCSGQNDTSIAVQVVVNPFYNCYCVTGIGGGCVTQAGTTIDSVAIETTTLANGPTGCSTTFHTLYPASGNTTATLTIGQTYNLDVTLQGNAKSEMWIDYDQSGTFDPTEGVQVCLTATAGVPNVVAFTVPAGALPGLTGMRVRSRSTAGTLDSTSACVNAGTGETEDYIVTLSTLTGIQSKLEKNQLYVFPNPASGTLNVAVLLQQASGLSLIIENLNGETVYAEQGGISNGVYNKTLNLSSLSKGVYFVKVISDKEVFTKKVILQ